MTGVKAILLDQLAACHNDDSWFKSSQTVLDDLSVAEVNRKPAGHPHSIRELATHLIFWNEMWLNRFIHDDMLEKSTLSNDQTFGADHHQADEESWQATVSRLSQSFDHWREQVAAADPAKLEKLIPAYYNAPWWAVVSNLCTHNVYHIGQMMQLKQVMRAQGV